MYKTDVVHKIGDMVDSSQTVVVVQADNPDGDSLASSLALEEILAGLGKKVHLYCGVDIPEHLRYIEGWDRVERELPKKFDLSIVVDTVSDTLLEQLDRTEQKMWLKSKPCLVIDHHDAKPSIDYAAVILQVPVVAVGEVIYELASELGWSMSHQAKQKIAVAILTDSLGLMSEGTSSRSIHIIGEIVDSGVSLAELENARREMSKRPAELVHYKGLLLQRVEFLGDGKIATIDIPWDEIEAYSHFYNPSMLVLDDMRLASSVRVAVAFKIYPDGKITGKIRCNYGSGIAGRLAESFGGGGHSYAAGFKIQDRQPLDEIKKECVERGLELLDELDTGKVE